jgi:hypothetical protein
MTIQTARTLVYIILVVSVKFVGKHKRPKLVGKHEGLLIGGLFFSFKGKE